MSNGVQRKRAKIPSINHVELIKIAWEELHYFKIEEDGQVDLSHGMRQLTPHETPRNRK
jgi:hypothetical protein